MADLKFWSTGMETSRKGPNSYVSTCGRWMLVCEVGTYVSTMHGYGGKRVPYREWHLLDRWQAANHGGKGGVEVKLRANASTLRGALKMAARHVETPEARAVPAPGAEDLARLQADAARAQSRRSQRRSRAAGEEVRGEAQ
jgi:hypothetical protein